jgi:hypothetical protein
MIRTMTALVLMAIAIPFATTDAHAADPELKAQKQEVKAARKYSKQVDKQVRKWEKGAAKGKDKKMAKADAELDLIVRDELARLRDLGVPTKTTEPKPINPKIPEKVIVMAPENPKMEEFRDELVELRDLQDRFESGSARPKDFTRKSALLSTLQDSVEDRYERKDKRYREAKG